MFKAYSTANRLLWFGAATVLLGSLVYIWVDNVTNHRASTDVSPVPNEQIASPKHTLEVVSDPEFSNQAQEQPEPIETVLISLLSTSIADKPKYSTATLLDQASGNTDIVQQDNTLSEHPEIKVESIIAGEVQLTDGKTWWTLHLDSLPPIREPLGPEDLIKILGANSKMSSEEQVEALLYSDAGRRTHDNILSEATFAPFIEDGEQLGLYLTGIQPNGFYARLGLSVGDVLLEVNGIRLNTPESIERAIEIFKKDTSINLWVNNDGELQRFRVDMTPNL